MNGALTRNRLIGFLVALAIFALDRVVKGLVTGRLQLQQLHAVHAVTGWPFDRPDIPILPIFGLTWTENIGVSLGMFPANSAETRYLLIAVLTLIALIVLLWMLRETRRWDLVALGLILGGALGNIRDRWSLGYVIDYADLHFGGTRPFLIFNLADTAITFGVVIILARSLFLREKRPHANTPAGDAPAEPGAPQADEAAETN